MTAVSGGAVAASPAAARSAGRRSALEHSCFALLPGLVCAFIVYEMVRGNIVAIDFRDAYRLAGHRLLVGSSPYAWTPTQIAGGEVFVYPSLAAVLMVPFALLPSSVAALLFSGLCAAAAAATLRMLDVRDWRLYGLTLVWPWVVAGWQTCNLTLLLGLGIALAWRHRDRPALSGLIVGALVSLKPFTAPIVLWLLVTRRYRAVGWGVAGALALNLIGWGIVGFAQIQRYVSLSSRVTTALEHTGYGLISAAEHIGLGHSVGIAIELFAAVLLVALMVIAGRRQDDRRALAAAIVLMLVASPLVWSHYFALLLIPVALAYPRLNRVWLLPLLLWGCAVRDAAEWQIVVTWAVVAVVCLEIVRPRTRAGMLAC
jgi:hypothetical protein